MRLIDADALKEKSRRCFVDGFHGCGIYGEMDVVLTTDISNAPTVDAAPVVHGRTYTAHEVAEILAEAFADSCACNFNGNDEWLPEKCELVSDCPYPVGVACWEQYLKFRETGDEDTVFKTKEEAEAALAKMDRKDDT